MNDLRISDDYRTATGFLRRGGIRSNSGNFGYEFQPKGRSWFVTLRPFVVVKRLVTTEGLTDESYVDPGFDLRLPRDVTFYVYHSFHRDAFVAREFDYQFHVVDMTAKAFKRASLEARLQWGEAVNFDPASGGGERRQRAGGPHPEALSGPERRAPLADEPPRRQADRPAPLPPGHLPGSDRLPVHPRLRPAGHRRIRRPRPALGPWTCSPATHPAPTPRSTWATAISPTTPWIRSC